MRLWNRLRLFLLIAGLAAAALAQADVLTSHNDNARTGLNSAEILLTPTNVNLYGFGKIFSQAVDGPVYAQPLYAAGVQITNKGTHNVVFVATMHDSVYAFDANSRAGSNAAPLWHTSFIDPTARITPVPTTDAVDFPGQDCQTFVGEIGIVGTPVIDATSGTLYVVARTKEPLPPPNDQSFTQVQRLHALDITSGAEKANSPVVITGIVLGSGDGTGGGFVRFNPARELQRSALLLVNGVVYIAWASYCDVNPYHGWIIGYDAQSLQRVGMFNTTPNGSEGGIWMAGAGPAAAPDGTIYCLTGNGTFDTFPDPLNFGDSFLQLTQTDTLSVTGFFTPSNQASLAAGDIDLGSGGALVLPDSLGTPAHPHLLVGCGKEGKIYLLDRDNMGGFDSASDHVVQEFPLYSGGGGGDRFFGLPALFKDKLYFQGVGEPLKAFAFLNGQLNPTPVSQTADTVGFRGATPSISANGLTNGIVWQLVPTPTPGVAALRAYDAEDLSKKLYDSYTSLQAGAPDRIGFVKFVVPTIANGKVYAGTTDALAVFGLRSIIWSITREVSGSIRLVFSGPTGFSNVLQASPDLAHWTDLGQGTPTGTGTFTYSETIAPGAAARFYRVKPE